MEINTPNTLRIIEKREMNGFSEPTLLYTWYCFIIENYAQIQNNTKYKLYQGK